MPLAESSSWVVAFVVGIAAGLVFTRAARRLAPQFGLMDRPDGRRKTQSAPVPTGGGVAVFLAALAALGVAAVVSPPAMAALTANPPLTFGLFLAAAIIVTVGVIDDRYNLRARYKLAGQAVAAAVLISFGGVVIEKIGVFGAIIELGAFAVPVTLFWLLACVNAMNLIDGMDGMLGTVALIALVCIAVMSGALGYPFAVVLAVALAGAVVGFLRYNLPPATVYMGDAGSMLLGLVIGALAISAGLKGPATVGLGASVAIVLLPMIDTTAAVLRRKLTGRGLATTDRGHLHHVLLRGGLSKPRALLVVAGLALIASAGALASTALNNDLFAVIAVVGVVVTLVATRLFGQAEFHLIRRWFGRRWRRLTADASFDEMVVHLQGTADWDDVWEDLTGCAEQLNLQSVCLDVNAPALHENYHAQWERSDGRGPASHLWRLEIPLFGVGDVIGRLAVSGVRDDEPVADKLMTLAKIIETAEVGAAEATRSPTPPATVPAA